MTRLVLDGVAYEVRAVGSGPAVLLVHGFTGRGTDWAPYLPDIRALGYRTVVVDLLGHGRSDSPPDPARYAVECQASALVTVLHRLDAAPAFVVGYSMGARIALRMTVDGPGAIRGLILTSPSAGIPDAGERAARLAADRALAARLEHDGLEAFLRAWEANPLFAGEHRLPQRRRDLIHRARARNTVEGLAESLRGAGQGAMEPLAARLRAITCPTLVIAGGLDPVGAERARAIADLIPSADLITLAHRGHAPHREAPAQFRRLIIEQLTAWRPVAA